jgi:hypothetical protein
MNIPINTKNVKPANTTCNKFVVDSDMIPIGDPGFFFINNDLIFHCQIKKRPTSRYSGIGRYELKPGVPRAKRKAIIPKINPKMVVIKTLCPLISPL